jgi:hypothetical protein
MLPSATSLAGYFRADTPGLGGTWVGVVPPEWVDYDSDGRDSPGRAEV